MFKYCCPIISKCLRIMNSEYKQRCLLSIYLSSLKIIVSMYGNYIIQVGDFGKGYEQDIIENYSPDISLPICQAVFGHVAELSIDSFGCFVIEKILQFANKNIVYAIIDELLASNIQMIMMNSVRFEYLS